MISHVVLFEPDAALAPERRTQLLDAIRHTIGQCPAVRACRIGRRVRHGLPGYEQLMRADFQYLLVLDFDDVSGLTAYLRDPAHAQLGQVFASASASLAYDYEVSNLTDAERLL